MQIVRFTYCQEGSLVVKKWRGICIYSVGKGACADSKAYLLAGRESCSEEMERGLHIVRPARSMVKRSQT
jgi:hypothetical protein